MTISRRAREHDVPAWLIRLAIIAACALVISLAMAALLWLTLRIQFIAIAVLIGFAEVSLLWPLVKWLRQRKVPQVIAAILCVVAFLSFFSLILVFVIAEVVRASPRLADQVVGAFNNVLEWARSGPFGMDDQTVQDILDELQGFFTDFVGRAGEYVATGLVTLANLVTVVLVATFFAIFALASGDKLWRQFEGVLSLEHRLPATAAFRSAMRTVGAWFYASTLTGLVDGLLIGLGLLILGVPLAIPIGALTFIMAYIPLLGATIAGAVAVAAALASQGLTAAIIALIIVLGVQQLEGNVLAPLLMSRAVSFHPLIILVMTTTAATLFGLAGLFLAVPVSGAVVAAISGYRRYSREAAATAELDVPDDEEPVATGPPGVRAPGGA
jgi:putative heme transporter